MVLLVGCYGVAGWLLWCFYGGARWCKVVAMVLPVVAWWLLSCCYGVARWFL